MSLRFPLRRRAATTTAFTALVAALVAVPAALPALVSPASAAVAASCAAALPVYGVGSGGNLAEWVQSSPVTGGAATVASTTAGTAWSGFRTVLAAGGGVLYTVSADGRLRWYRHTGEASGADTWAPASGTVVGQGWGVFTTIVSAGNGLIYGIKGDGTLHWYLHTGYATGSATWAGGSGLQVGVGWHTFTRVVPGGYGALYALSADGTLRWYAHDGWQTGRTAWAAGSGTVVGVGFQMFTTVLSGGGGLLYGVMADGSVRWYDHLGDVTGAKSWAAGSGATVAGLSVAGYTQLVADPTVCTGLDRTDTTAVRRVASGVLAGGGWSSSQFSCLSAIADRESSWLWDAGSPTGTYGIPQVNPGARMASAGSNWVGDPVTQVRWMLSYVVARYGTPCGAWAFWQTHHYY